MFLLTFLCFVYTGMAVDLKASRLLCTLCLLSLTALLLSSASMWFEYNLRDTWFHLNLQH